jgi:hypothetical protein
MDLPQLVIPHVVRSKPYAFFPFDLICLNEGLLLRRTSLGKVVGADARIATDFTGRRYERFAQQVEQETRTRGGTRHKSKGTEFAPIGSVLAIGVKPSPLRGGFRVHVGRSNAPSWVLGSKGRIKTIGPEELFENLKQLYGDLVKYVSTP